MERRQSNIVLLDNDERIVELVTWYLGEQGHRVRTCATFAEARAAIAEERPDLLLSDVDLGTESALAELPKLSAEGVLPPTLVVSGFLDAGNQATIAGVPEVMGTLAKPFEFADLEGAIQRALAGERVMGEAPVGEAPAPAAAPPATEVPATPATDDGDEDDDGWIEIQPAGGGPGRP